MIRPKLIEDLFVIGVLKFVLNKEIWGDDDAPPESIKNADLESIMVLDQLFYGTVIEAYLLTSMGFEIRLLDNEFVLYIHEGRMYDSNIYSE